MRSASVILTIALLITASVATWSQTGSYTPAELDELLGPIALYPDPLLAQVLPAATYPDELQEAYGFQGSIDSQPWSVSVKAVAHYPDVLRMMATNLDWTTAVGQAYVNQPDDVMRSIQRLRAKARSLGYLSSNSYQTVAVSNGYIAIDPLQPQYIYVPTYNPGVVYVEQRPSYGPALIAFGVGLLIGAWLNNDIDWHHHRVYYHGWHGGGWVGRSRPHVRVNNRTYVNPAWGNRAAPVNRDVRTRNITTYRRDVKRNTGKFTPPGLVAPHPGAPTTRPGRPIHKPGTRPGTPEAIPGVPTPKPNIPGGTGPGTHPVRPVKPVKPGVVTPHPAKPVTPAVPSATRPGYRPGARPHPAVPAVPRVPSAHPNYRPGAAVHPTAPHAQVAHSTYRHAVPMTPHAQVAHPTYRHEVPMAPREPVAHPNYRPGGGGPRPMAPIARPAPRPSAPVARPMPAARPAAPRDAPAPKGGGEKEGGAKR